MQGMGNPGRLLLRRLSPNDADAFRRHFLRLSPADRVARFGGHLGDEAVTAYADGIDWGTDSLLGAFVGDELRGVAELRRPHGLADTGEVALSIEWPFQGAGLGTSLFARLHLAARNGWTRELFFLSQRDNHRIQRIGRRFGAVLEGRGSEVLGRLRPEPPTPLSLLAEGCDELLAMMAAA